MTLHQLRVFLKVADLRSFTQAAKALHISQPSVSALVQDLVRELRVKLFEKRGMKVVLTPAGNVLFGRAKEAFGILEGAKEEIGELEGLKKGKITVGGASVSAATFLPLAIQAFKKNHPGIEVDLSVDRSSRLEEQLLTGALDVAILGFPPRSNRLLGELYREEEIVAIAPRNHPLARKRSVRLLELTNEAIIAPEKNNPVRKLIEKRFALEGIPFKPGIELKSPFGTRDVVKNAVTNGLAIGFVSKCHAMGDVKAGRLKILKIPNHCCPN